VNESILGGPAWLDHVRRVEDGGVDVFLVRDHFSAGAYGQQFAPFSALAAAAAVTTRLHVGTLVLANDFRHPVIVAHEAASLHHLSGGRFELGMERGGTSPNMRRRASPSSPRGGASVGLRSRWLSSAGCWTAPG
jgi:alkanesulfonate monooxygenase SsuD/methylene tetrahydromethanopterin reductase-like flavin-dependent oxidoreductase (luciferase family)